VVGPRLLTSTKAPVIKRIRALAAHSTRDSEGRFVLDGVRLIEEAIAADVPLDVCVYDPAAPRGACIDGLLDRSRVEMNAVADRPELADVEHRRAGQGVVALDGRRRLSKLRFRAFSRRNQA